MSGSLASVVIEETTAVVSLAQPARGNALSAELVETLINAVDRCIANEEIDTLVFTAEGRNFCTGFDLGDHAQASETSDESMPPDTAFTDGPLLWRFVRVEHLLSLIWHAPLRTVAVAQGRAWGAGADLFAACDVRLADATTQWKFPGAGFGLVLGTRRLGTLVGADLALDWVSHGRSIETGQAASSGFATSIIENAADWRAHVPRLAVRRPVHAQLKAATRADMRDADLAALVRSAAHPGLADRIQRYRVSTRPPTRASG